MPLWPLPQLEMFLDLWLWVSFDDSNHDAETGKPTAFKPLNNDFGGEGESWKVKAENARILAFSSFEEEHFLASKK